MYGTLNRIEHSEGNKMQYKHIPKDPQQLWKDNLIVEHLSGSHSYGTNTPESDLDIRGIFCGDPINIRTDQYRIEEVSVSGQDYKLYEFAHWCKLAAENNPNIIETLYVDPTDIRQKHPAYDLLRANRDAFLSAKIAFTFSGYAISQLKRIKGHNKWINNPQPVEPPEQSQFISLVQNLTPKKLLTLDWENRDLRTEFILCHFGGDIYGVYYFPGIGGAFHEDGSIWDRHEELSDGEHTDLRKNPMFIVKFNREEYKLARQKHEQYWLWKNNRNPDRSKLEEQHGFDSKHGMHLVRLLRMCVEGLTEGTLYVKRPDAQELLDIRNGKMSYDQIIQYAEEQDRFIREKYYPEALSKKILPKSADILRVANLVIDVQDLMWG